VSYLPKCDSIKSLLSVGGIPMLVELNALLKSLQDKTSYEFFADLNTLAANAKNAVNIADKNISILSKTTTSLEGREEYQFKVLFYLAVKIAIFLENHELLEAVKTYKDILANYTNFFPSYKVNPEQTKLYYDARDHLLTYATLHLAQALSAQGKDWIAFVILLRGAQKIQNAMDGRIQYYGDLAFNLAKAVLEFKEKHSDKNEFKEALVQVRTMLHFLYRRHEMLFNAPETQNGVCYHEPAWNDYKTDRGLLHASPKIEKQIYLALSCRDLSNWLGILSDVKEDPYLKKEAYTDRAARWKGLADTLKTEIETAATKPTQIKSLSLSLTLKAESSEIKPLESQPVVTTPLSWMRDLHQESKGYQKVENDQEEFHLLREVSKGSRFI